MGKHSGFQLQPDGVIRGNSWGLPGVTGSSPTVVHTGTTALTTLVDIDISGIGLQVGDVLDYSYGFYTNNNVGIINTASYLNMGSPSVELSLSDGMNLQAPGGAGDYYGRYSETLQILPAGGSGNQWDVYGYDDWIRYLAASKALEDCAGGASGVGVATSTDFLNLRVKCQLVNAADTFQITGFLLNVNGVRL